MAKTFAGVLFSANQGARMFHHDRTSLYARTGDLLILAFLLGALLVFGSTPALAQDSESPSAEKAANSTELKEFEPAAPEPSVAEERQSIAKLQERVEKLEQKLATIRDKAMDNNPELETKLKDLVMTRNEALQNNLKDSNVDMERLKELQKNLENEDLKQAERNKLEKEFKDMFLGYKQAEMKTNRNETVRNLRKDFYDDLLKAFKEQNPEAEKLISELSRLKHQLRYAKDEAMPQQNKK
jgi:hypothetical protein